MIDNNHNSPTGTNGTNEAKAADLKAKLIGLLNRRNSNINVTTDEKRGHPQQTPSELQNCNNNSSQTKSANSRCASKVPQRPQPQDSRDNSAQKSGQTLKNQPQNASVNPEETNRMIAKSSNENIPCGPRSSKTPQIDSSFGTELDNLIHEAKRQEITGVGNALGRGDYEDAIPTTMAASVTSTTSTKKLSEVDREKERWLEATGYYDEAYREERLTLLNRRGKLEDELRKVDEQEKEHIASLTRSKSQGPPKLAIKKEDTDYPYQQHGSSARNTNSHGSEKSREQARAPSLARTLSHGRNGAKEPPSRYASSFRRNSPPAVDRRRDYGDADRERYRDRRSASPRGSMRYDNHYGRRWSPPRHRSRSPPLDYGRSPYERTPPPYHTGKGPNQNYFGKNFDPHYHEKNKRGYAWTPNVKSRRSPLPNDPDKPCIGRKD